MFSLGYPNRAALAMSRKQSSYWQSFRNATDLKSFFSDKIMKKYLFIFTSGLGEYKKYSNCSQQKG